MVLLFSKLIQVEKERGITVKAVTASLNYVYKNQNYLLNLIDTPGHVDFSNEVLLFIFIFILNGHFYLICNFFQVVRSVQACQGAILLVDAAEGPRAQTIAVHLLSKQQNLNIIPVLNKIDLPRANAVKVKNQLFSLFNIEPDSILEVSAKKGWGIENLVNSIIERIPPPNVKREGFLRALIFDTWYDKYRGILCLAYIENGTLKIGDSIKWLSSKKVHPIKYLLLLTPQEKNITHAAAGQVVVVGCGPRGGGEVGDIILSSDAPIDETKKIQPIVNRHMVYAGIFPATQADYAVIQKAIEKLSMNDPAVSLSDDARCYFIYFYI